MKEYAVRQIEYVFSTSSEKLLLSYANKLKFPFI